MCPADTTTRHALCLFLLPVIFKTVGFFSTFFQTFALYKGKDEKKHSIFVLLMNNIKVMQKGSWFPGSLILSI